MKPKDLAALATLAALWGASFLFMRIASPAVGPLVLVWLRVALAALFLIGYGLVLREAIQVSKHWRAFVRLGVVNAAIPFALIAYASLYLPAATTAILNATTPLFTVAWVAWRYKRRVAWPQALGMVSGIVGVVILVGWTPVDGSWLVGSAFLASLLAAVSYAIGGDYAGRLNAEQPVSALSFAIGQQLGAAAILLLPALAALPRELPSLTVVAAILGLAFISTAIGYLLYFRLIRRVGASKTLTVTFLVPGFATLWGALLLGEPITWQHGYGMLCIIGSILLVTETRLPIRRRSPGPAQLSPDSVKHNP